MAIDSHIHMSQHRRTKFLREFIQELPVSFRWEQMEKLQEQRNIDRLKQWEAKRA